jgi:hypothetical protein
LHSITFSLETSRIITRAWQWIAASFSPPPLFILKSKSFLILFFLAGVSKKIKKSREKN